MSRSKCLQAVLLIFVATLTAEIPSQAQETLVAGLKGKVQTVLTEEFTSDDGISRERSGSTLDVYDPAGYKLQSFLYKSDGSLWAHTVYYRNGPRILRVDVTGVPENDGTRIAPFEPYSEQDVYDAKGREIERDTYDANGVLVSKSTNTVAQQQPNSTIMDQRTETIKGGESTTAMMETTETTDPQTGMSHLVATKNGQVYLDVTSQQNTDGTERDKQVEPDGSYVECERQSNGGIRAQHSYSAITKTHYYTTMDAQGHMTEMIEKSESHYRRSEYSFDKQGRPTGQTDYDASGNILEKSTSEYRNDPHGNWVEKKSIVWNTNTKPMQSKTVTFSFRTINYY